MSNWFEAYGFADVHDDLIVGSYPLDANDVRTIQRLGIRRILNLVEDREYGPGEREAVEQALAEAGIEETRLTLADYGHLPADALEAAVSEVSGWLRDGQVAYVHCRAGWQRSAAVAAGVIAVTDGIGIEEALAQVRRRKPSANPLPHQREELLAWWHQRSGGRVAPEIP
ncbi:MAG: dual specificity protein phosphatase family protein [Solirubrobacteraceae bacterium]